MKIKLSGKTALVTGGSRGIGRAAALLLGRLGAEVCINFLRKKSLAEEAAEIITRNGGSACIYRADVGNPEQCREMTGYLKDKFGRIDIFVSNAVFGVLNRLTEIKPKHLQKTIDTNLGAFANITGEMVKINGDLGGRIVAVSSIGAVRTIDNYSIIGASKAAIESLVRHIAVEYGPMGYRVNAVAPGLVDTDSLSYFPDKDKMIEKTVGISPVKRICTPKDVAGIIAFLCSEYTDMINGQVITIDGGASLPY